MYVSDFGSHIEPHLSSSPADIRGARNSLAINTLDALKPNKTRAKPSTQKNLKTRKPSAKPDMKEANTEESYHFIGYVPAFGKVWELVSSSARLWCVSN